MSLQPGSSYVNYLAVKKLLPLDDYANPYPSTTIFAVDSSGVLAGYRPDAWFSTIGMPNPSTLQSEIVSTIGIINSALGSTTYGLVSTMNIVNKDILTSSLTSTVGGLAATTGVSQAQLDAVIKGLGTTGYVSSTQLASTVAGLGTAGYLSTGADGLLRVRAISTGSVSLSTLALVDTTNSASVKLLYNKAGGLYFGGSQLGGTITDLSLNTLDVSNATVYQDLAVGGSIVAPTIYNNTLFTVTVNGEKNPVDRIWAVAGEFGAYDFGVQFSSNNGASWDVSVHLFTGAVNQIKYFNGIWFALGQYGIGDNDAAYYSLNNGVTWTGLGFVMNQNIFDIGYNGSYYVLVSDHGVYTSLDGMSWTLSPSSPITYQCITYNGTYWVAAGSSTIGYSLDGVSWSNASGSFGSPNFKAIAYNGHTLVAADSNSANIYYSDNKGLSWTAVAVAVGGSQNPSVTWNGTYFLVGTRSPNGLYYSRDGRSWMQSPTTLSETVTSMFWNGRVTYGVGTTYIYETTDGITWTPITDTYSVTSPTSISYSVYVGDDIITENNRYYGVDIPHYYDSTNQIYAGPDRLILNNTLTVKDGRIGIMKGDPGVHLDIQGAARASTISVSTLQLADTTGQILIEGNSGMVLINRIPIVQSTVAGLGQTYVSIPSLTSTVAGLGTAGYVSSESLASTVSGLGTARYVSSQSLASTVSGLGTAGYVSSQSLASTVAGLGTAGYVSSQSLASTVAGLGNAGYISSQSLASTVAGLGQIYVSTQGLTTVIQGLGTIGYISSQSLAFTVSSLLTNLQVSTFSASTIGYAKLFTSTVYVGNDNLSTNLIRFYGTNADGPGQPAGPYSHTVIAERIYAANEESELLFFKGNEANSLYRDRIRHLAGAHQFDIIQHGSQSIWPETTLNPPVPKISGAMFIDTEGHVGIGTKVPNAFFHISTSLDIDNPTFNIEANYSNGSDSTNPITQIQIANGVMNRATTQYSNNALLRLDTSGSASSWNYISAVSTGTQVFSVSQDANMSLGGSMSVGGSLGVGTTTPARALHVRPLNDNGVVRLDRVTGSGPAYHMHYFDGSSATTPLKGFSMRIDDVSGANTGKFIIGDLQEQVAGFTALPRIVVDSSGNVGIGTTTPSYSLDVSGSFYASTINYAKLYTSTVYVGNANMSTNMIRFYGTHNDDGASQTIGPYSHTVIAERIYEADEKSELLFFKGNDLVGGVGPDRIRHLAAAHQFDIIATSSEWPDTSGNPPDAGISGALYIDNTGKVGVGTTSPGASLDVSGSFISRLKFVDIASGAASFTLNTTHYGAYLYLQPGFANTITLPTGGSAPPDGTVVVIINGTSGSITIGSPPTVGNTSASISAGATRTFAYHTTGPVWIGL